MKISLQHLNSVAKSTGFRPEMLEKVIHLLNLLDSFRGHPFLKDRLVLKGGTALNLFFFDLPRLSVDIDLNYTGAEELETMTAERPRIEEAVHAVCSREGLSVRRAPEEHAGGKWLLRYESAFGQSGNLQIDINFMYRVPLWPVVSMDSHSVGPYQARDIRVPDIHELAAGKLAALLYRCQGRDLFDAHRLLNSGLLDRERLRTAFVVYGAMNRKDWRIVSPQDILLDPEELADRLFPMLRGLDMPESVKSAEWGRRLQEECLRNLSIILPFSEMELRFLNLLLDEGKIEPGLLTTDTELQKRILAQPLLAWKALNVKKHKGVE